MFVEKKIKLKKKSLVWRGVDVVPIVLATLAYMSEKKLFTISSLIAPRRFKTCNP